MEKYIAGYEGLYTISEEGEVKSSLNHKVVKQYTNDRGYKYVNLSKDGIRKKYRVHRLVAQMFIPNTEELPVVDHMDCNKTNNAASNLRWCTQLDNVRFYLDTQEREPKADSRVYGTVEDMIKATGKEIVVDGITFPSAGSAAQYIVDRTENKNKATISKELRRFLQGKREAWVMYGRFTIGY